MPRVHFFYQRKKVACEVGETVLEVARAHNIPLFRGWSKIFHCRGLGICKACRVRVVQTTHLSPPSFIERGLFFLQPSPWRQGCRARILDDVIVWTPGDFPTILPPGEQELQTAQQTEETDDVEVEELTPEEVKALLDRGEPIILLDVREPIELERARIEGALSIPLSQLTARTDELDPEASIVVYCHHGLRSHTAAEILLASDFKRVRHMAGGIDGWSLKIDFSVPRY